MNIEMRKIHKSVPCPPYGNMELVYESGIIKYLLTRRVYIDIKKNWAGYWLQMFPAVTRLFEDYSKPNCFGQSKFSISMKKSGGWIDDDVMFELLFANDPAGFSIAWVTAFKNGKLVHSQASF